MSKIKGIVEAVKNNIIKDDNIEELAKQRINICETSGEDGGYCENHSQTSVPFCRDCGCPLFMRTKSTKYGCPIGKW